MEAIIDIGTSVENRVVESDWDNTVSNSEGVKTR
jgi:hypothetical protein